MSTSTTPRPRRRVTDWREDAACLQYDPELFFPDKGGSSREAKQICASCLVQAECLDGALAADERFGVWGGLSERERRKVAKRLDTAAPAGTGVCGTYPRGYNRHKNADETPCDDCRRAAAIYTENRRTYGASRPVDLDDLDGPGSGIPPSTQPTHTPTPMKESA